jgi:hypothetical protein
MGFGSIFKGIGKGLGSAAKGAVKGTMKLQKGLSKIVPGGDKVSSLLDFADSKINMPKETMGLEGSIFDTWSNKDATSGGPAGKSGMGKFLGKLDPNMLALSGLSMLGDDGPQERKSFAGSGRSDPKFALGRAMQINDELVQEIRNRMASRSANGPVILPELPTQIGGGLGMDPAKRMNGLTATAARRKPKPEEF